MDNITRRYVLLGGEVIVAILFLTIAFLTKDAPPDTRATVLVGLVAISSATIGAIISTVSHQLGLNGSPGGASNTGERARNTGP